MRTPKYKVGDEINGRIVVSFINGKYTLQCKNCKKVTRGKVVSRYEMYYCSCVESKRMKGRFSGLSYVNSEEKLESIKRKYAYGVPSECIEQLAYDMTR